MTPSKDALTRSPILASFITAASIILTASAHGAEFVPIAQLPQVPSEPSFVVGAGLGVRTLNYREHLTSPTKSTESGTLPSLNAFVVRHSSEGDDFLTGSFDYTQANLKYDGSTQSGTPVTMTG